MLQQRTMFSVLLIDGQMLVRRGLRQVLAEEFRGTAFSDAGTADQALAEVRRRDWHLVILGTIPGKSELQILQAIRKLHPKISVLVLDNRPEAKRAMQCLRSGALAYISKDTNRSELVTAVGSALAGRKYLPATLTTRASKTTSDSLGGYDALSPRELSVMLAIATGKRIGEIATELRLSIKTVSTFKNRIKKKLGLKSTADVVRYVIDHQLS